MAVNVFATSTTRYTDEDFEILKNGVDDRIEIIRHKPTGFYNITKMTNLVYKLKLAEAGVSLAIEPPGIPGGSDKEKQLSNIAIVKKRDPSEWFRNDSTTSIIETAKRRYGNEIGICILSLAPKPCLGIFVHPKLYDHFMMWLDVDYAFRVYEILNKIHQDAQRQKDTTISRLEVELQAFRNEATARLNEIVQQNKRPGEFSRHQKMKRILTRREFPSCQRNIRKIQPI